MTSPKPFIIGRTEWLKNNNARVNLRRGGHGTRSARMAANVRGVPQIVFKVVKNGGCHGPNGLAAQMDYVLGKADHIIDPNKQIDRLDHLPPEYTRAMAADWAEGWNRKVDSGHSMHMVASFPRGTDPEAVAEIVRATCFDLLDQGRSRFNYVAAVHTDKDHPHAHIIVDRRNSEGEFFYFARDHEFNYDVFKDRIVEHAASHGIELVNSSRMSRGLTAPPQAHPREALRGLAGTLVAFGEAPYQNKPKERASYFVTVQTPAGEKTLWGKELRPAVEAAQPAIGDRVRITHEGKEAVSVRTKDGWIETHRNRWAVEVPERDRTDENLTPKAPTSGGLARPASDEEVRAAEWRQQKLAAHIEEYRGLAESLGPDYPALSRGFAVAAQALEQGRALTSQFIETLRGDRVMPDDQLMKEESERLAQTIEQARNDLMAVRDRIDDMPPAERPELEAKYFDAVRDMQEIEKGFADREYIEPANGTIYAENAREQLQGMDHEQLSAALEGTGIDPDELAARLSVQSSNAALEAHWVEADARAIASERGYDLDTEAGRDQAFKEVLDTYNGLSRSMEQDRGYGEDHELDAATAIMAQTNREGIEAQSAEVTIPVITGTGERLEMTEAQVREAAVTDKELRLESPVDENNLEPTDENIAALRDFHERERMENAVDYDASGDPDRIGAQAEAQFDRSAGDERGANSYSVYSSRTGEVQEFSTAREAGAAFAEADAKDLPSASEITDQGVRRMATTVGIGDERSKSVPSLESVVSDPTSRASDREFWGGYHERMEMQHTDNRDLVEAVEDRQALINEAKELASRDTLTDDQQRRLTEIVDKTLGREAAQELKAGNTEVLRDFGGRDDQINLAERYLQAEQAHGADRTAALDAVSKDRELNDMSKQDERAQELERQDEQVRQRSREEGLER